MGMLLRSPYPEATGFDPLTIPGLQALWLLSDASSLWQDTSATTPVTSLDDPIGRIDDLSGNGYHLLVYGGDNSRRPLYKPNALNGLAGAHFVGADDGLVTGAVAGWSGALQLLLVYRMVTVAAGAPSRKIIASAHNAPTFANHQTTSAPTTTLYNGASELSASSAPAYPSAALITLSADGASSYIRSNGAEIVSGNAGSADWNGLYFGAPNEGPWGPGWGADMELYAAAVVKPPVTGTDLTDAEDYFMTTWGI